MHHEHSNDDSAPMNWADCPALERDPRMAVLFENMRDGVSLAEVVEIFPGVTTAQARLVLDHVARSRKGRLSPAWSSAGLMCCHLSSLVG
jgi:hypothetical protein